MPVRVEPKLEAARRSLVVGLVAQQVVDRGGVEVGQRHVLERRDDDGAAVRAADRVDRGEEGLHVELVLALEPADGQGGLDRPPAGDEQLAVRFEDGEILRWRGSGHVAELRRSHAEDPDSVFRAWTIEPLTQLVVTDRRLIYTGQGLKVDRRGPAAQMMAETLRAYNVLPERGRVLVGQVRFDWPVRMSVRPVDHAWPGAALTVTCVDGDSEADRGRRLPVFIGALRATCCRSAATRWASWRCWRTTPMRATRR